MSCKRKKSTNSEKTIKKQKREQFDGNVLDTISCPITRQIMCEPVIVSDGHTYELEAIENWIKISQTSPFTNEVLNVNYGKLEFVINYSIKRLINAYLTQYPDKKSEIYKPNINYDRVVENKNFKRLLEEKVIDLAQLLESLIYHKMENEFLGSNTIKYVIDHADNLEAKTKGYKAWKLVHMICNYKNGKYEDFEYLAEKGCDIVSRTGDGYAPIELIFDKGDETIKYLEYFIKKKIDINAVSEEYGSKYYRLRPIEVAFYEHNYNALIYLLDHVKIDPESRYFTDIMKYLYTKTRVMLIISKNI
jgi:hypothetical protein